MKRVAILLPLLVSLLTVQAAVAEERVGKVEFANTCSAAVQSQINRGIALLHDFWYEEAKRQFQDVYTQDPKCAIAHWGAAMSVYHQIWNRPDEKARDEGWSEIQKAKSIPLKDPRQRQYIAAATIFYQPGKTEYQTRVDQYSAAMRNLYRHYPNDIDAGAFYALSLLASEEPGDTSLSHERQALAILNPLFEKYPGHPGLAHYIIHSCDNPAMAQQGLHAAERYGDIAPSAAHSAHMPGHIFARLGMWQQDIQANLVSVAASEYAETKHHGDGAHSLHAYDFLLYAYLQSGQDAKAKEVVDKTAAILNNLEAMGDMDMMGMGSSFVPMYRIEFPAIYHLERRDWNAAAALTPNSSAPPESQFEIFWARGIAQGHLRQAEAARANLADLAKQEEIIKKGPHAYFLQGNGQKITHGELEGWAAFAEGNEQLAIEKMRTAADLQDKVGQGEVDIPAREMLADLMLECKHPQQALAEYETALKLSPNRFDALYGAGMAAEATGDRAKAATFYTQLLKQTDKGANSNRPEVAHAKTFSPRLTSSN
jgi:tetratricopeptide (TPR) repeat protein